MVNLFLIGISGGSCSGKTTFAQKLGALIGDDNTPRKISIISEDDYYHDQTTLPDVDFYDGIFDNPIVRDHDLLLSHLEQLSRGQSVQIPQYDFVNHCRSPYLQSLDPSEIIILEGLHLFCNDALSQRLNFKVFIELDDETRLERRLERDINERGRSKASVLSQYQGVRHAYDAFINPVKTRADFITSGNFDDKTLLNISQIIRNQIMEKINHL